MTKKGKIYLVGAGPGDEGLITVKGLEYLKTADVVIYDYLVNEELLKHCKTGSEKIYVGKKASEHTLSQQGINELLIEKAKQGFIVVRLKGGDPFIFGRGSEEAMELKNNDIEYEIIPGITAGIAAPSYAGIPITHRGYASSIAFITGHEDTSKMESDINWDKIATGIGTLVFYMGVANLPFIVSKLKEFGRAGDTPVALIRWGTHNFQQTITGNLDSIVKVAEENNFLPPAIIVVGEVVKLRDKLRWFDNKPLFGKRIIVTRSRTQASGLCRNLKNLGADVIEFPTIDIIPVKNFNLLDDSIHNIRDFSWIIFTSVNSVEIFFKRLFELNYDSRILKNGKIAVIGAETGNALKQFGIIPDLVPTTYTSEGTVEAFRLMKDEIKGEKILLPCSAIARDIIPSELEKLGAVVKIVLIYENVIPDYSEEKIDSYFEREFHLVTFTSSSTVMNLAEIFRKHKKEHLIGKIKGASIGPVTTETAKQNGINIVVEAKIQTIEGLTDCILEYFSDKKGYVA